MLKYKMLITLFVLNCVPVCCIYVVTIQADVTVLFVLVSLYHNTVTSAWMVSPYVQHTDTQFSTNNVISILYFNVSGF